MFAHGLTSYIRLYF